jgi:hypothetical protein
VPKEGEIKNVNTTLLGKPLRRDLPGRPIRRVLN